MTRYDLTIQEYEWIGPEIIHTLHSPASYSSYSGLGLGQTGPAGGRVHMGVSRLNCAPGLDPAQLLFWTGTEQTLKLLNPFGPF